MEQKVLLAVWAKRENNPHLKKKGIDGTMRQTKIEYNDFYCLNCGKPIPLPRKVGHQHLSGHRKVIYCPFCRETVNHIQCKSYADVIEFKEAFKRGDFIEEAKESIDFVRSNG